MFTLAGNLYTWAKKKQEKSVTIILLGLDNAGKSTLLYSLKGEMPHNAHVTPTIGFRPSKLVSGKYTIQWFDVGGAKNFRRVWQNYYPEVHGIIFVVDGADLERIEEAKETLSQTLDSEGIGGKPILIFSNKQDLDGCISEKDLSEKLGMLERKNCRYQVAACSAKPKEGEPIDTRIGKGLRWLLDSVDSNYKALHARVTSDTEEMKAKEKQRREEQKKRAEANKAARLKEQEEAEAAAAAAAAAAEKEGGGKKEGDGVGISVVVEDGVKQPPVENNADAVIAKNSPGVHEAPPAEPEGGAAARDVKAPAKLEVDAENFAPVPGKLPMMDGTPTRSVSPGPRLTDLKPMPPPVNKAPPKEVEDVLPGSIPSPEAKIRPE